jgi:hypothetical protein
VSKQLANYRQPKAAARTEGRIGVAQVMKANAVEAGTTRDGFPRTFQIGARLLEIISRHDVRAEPIKASQHGKCGSVQNHSLSTALAVREEKQPTLKIDVFPPEMEDFP